MSVFGEEGFTGLAQNKCITIIKSWKCK